MTPATSPQGSAAGVMPVSHPASRDLPAPNRFPPRGRGFYLSVPAGLCVTRTIRLVPQGRSRPGGDTGLGRGGPPPGGAGWLAAVLRRPETAAAARLSGILKVLFVTRRVPGADRTSVCVPGCPWPVGQDSGDCLCDLANLSNLPARTRSLIPRTARIIPRIFRIIARSRPPPSA